ncbi:hypothetical protein [Nocardioides daeguensis]|nr:hypothetical protein [Nocardioides daeguensis]MBV6726286.1 hypothetical protein [Nocardioides daeguensis]MCR1772129.1 hypothetical protein [Nocardioides daeguensis]
MSRLWGTDARRPARWQSGAMAESAEQVRAREMAAADEHGRAVALDG